MNKFRAWQFWGKFLGPLLGTIYLYLPSFDVSSIPLFNAATYAPLTTIVFIIITIPIVFLFCKNVELKKPVDPIPIWKDSEAKQVIFDISKLFVIYVASLTALWVVFAQIMPIGVIFFQIATEDPSSIWLIYIPPLAGAIIGMFVTKRVIIPMKLHDNHVLIGASICVTLSLFTFIQFADHEPSYIYYIGCTILFLAFGILATAFRSIYSKTVGNSRHLAVLMSLLFSVGAIGQIVGPVFSSFFIEIDCTSASSSDAWGYGSCTMSGLNIAVSVGIGAMALSTVFTAVLLYFIGIPSLEKNMKDLQNLDDSFGEIN